MFIYSSVEGDLFLLFDYYNAAVNSCVKFLIGYKISIILCKYQRGIASHMITRCLTFWRASRLLYKVAAPFLHSCQQCFTFPISPHPHWHYCLSFLNYYLFLRDRDKAWAWGGEGTEREGDTESEAGSRLWIVSTEPDVGLTHQLWDHDLSRHQMLNQLIHPGAPVCIFFFIKIAILVGMKQNLTLHSPDG